MVSEADREHFRQVAIAEAEMEWERLREAGLRSPGDNMELAIRWSDCLLRIYGVPDEAWELPSLLDLWRRRPQRHP